MSSTTVPTADSPALVRLLPYAQSGVISLISFSAAIFRAIFSALAFIAKIIAHPIVLLSPFPVLLYILAPVIIFVQIFLDIAVYTPLRAIAYFSDAVYPAYVFLGVACITGALVGLSGRLTVLGLVHVLSPPSPVLLVESNEKKPRQIS